MGCSRAWRNPSRYPAAGISSFIPVRTVPYTCLKEYVYLTGAELCISSGVSAVSNLGSYGWNDRASSIDFR